MYLALALAAALLQTPTPGATPTPAQLEEQETCLTCHADASLAVDLPNGEHRSLHVDLDKFRASVHGRKLTCLDCHAEMKEVPHPERAFKSARDFTLAYYEQCKRCHFSEYTKTLDSVHYAALARGDRTAPLCVDCHGSHEIADPTQSRTLIVEHLRQVPRGRLGRVSQERPRAAARRPEREGRAGLQRLPPHARRRRAA